MRPKKVKYMNPSIHLGLKCQLLHTSDEYWGKKQVHQMRATPNLLSWNGACTFAERRSPLHRIKPNAEHCINSTQDKYINPNKSSMAAYLIETSMMALFCQLSEECSPSILLASEFRSECPKLERRQGCTTLDLER